MRQVEDRGLEGLTLQEIARELDYTVASLYRYFPSKDALVAELQRRVVELLDHKLAEVEDATASWLRTLAPDARERIAELAPLAATGLFYSGLALSAPQAFGLLAVSLGDPRHLIDDVGARAVIETAQPIFDRIARHCERAVAAGRLAPSDANDRALVLWSSLHGVAQLAKLRRLAPDRIDSERLCGSLLRTLLVGWGGDPLDVAATLRTVRAADVAHATVCADDLVHDPAFA
jgi:AcrR family transcriptional regulator